MIDSCSIPNTAISSVFVAVAVFFVLDALLREIRTEFVKTRLAAFAASASQFSYIVLDSDPTYTVASSVLYYIYTAAGHITALYFCEVFILLYLDLPEESSRTLHGVVRMYPVLRIALVAVTVPLCVLISIYTINVVSVVSSAVIMVCRILTVFPTFAVMLRLAFVLRQHRLTSQHGKCVETKLKTKKFENLMFCMGVAAMIFLAAAMYSYTDDMIEAGRNPRAKWQRYCSASLATTLTANITFIVGLTLMRAPTAQWRSWTRNVRSSADLETTSDEENAPTLSVQPHSR